VEILQQIIFTFFGAAPLWLHFGEILWVMETVFKRKMFLNFKVIHLCDLDGLKHTKWDKYLLRVLLVGCKKAPTRKWLKKDKLTVNEWIDVIYNIYVVDRITFKLGNQTDVLKRTGQNGSAMC